MPFATFYHDHTITLVLVIILVIAVLPTWPYSRNWEAGYVPSGLIAAILIVLLLFGCSTTKTVDSNGTTTTTTSVDNSQATQAAIAAGIQVATAAATAAVQTYLVTPKPPEKLGAHRLTISLPPFARAIQVTEAEVRKIPNLPLGAEITITRDAFLKAIRK